MNISYLQHRALTRFWAVVTMFAVLLSAFVAPFSVAFAQDSGTNGDPATLEAPTGGDSLESSKKAEEPDTNKPKKNDPLPPATPAPQTVANIPAKQVTICHATAAEANPFNSISVDENGLNGHGVDTDDILPKTPEFPDGQNLEKTYSAYGGKTGAQILALDCPKPPQPTKDVKISITKIICEDETKLPNDGYAEITAGTAAAFLAQNPSCYAGEDAQFQWAKGGVDITTDNTGELNSPWKTSGYTNEDGKVIITLSEKDVKNQSIISVREVWNDNYIPFTGKSSNNVSAELYCAKDAANFDNLEWIGQNETLALDKTYHCVAWNVPVLEEIEICKYDAKDVAIEGWEMTLTNGDKSFTLETEKDGCVSQMVNPNIGPWSVSEETQKDWEQVNATAQNGYVYYAEDEETQMCEFFGRQELKTLVDGDQPVDTDNRCVFTNEYVPPCVDKPNGDWAGSVVKSDQKLRKDGSAITDPNRMDDEKVLGAADWVVNDSTNFFALGFGGSVVVEFDSYVPNVPGNDIAIHEATNGTYPTETALVEVSQDGVVWKPVGTANNINAGKISYFDFDSTGYLWIKFVKVTDTTNPALHSNDADGFDVDAIAATKSVCKAPEEPKICKVTIVSDETNTVNGAAAKLVSVINGAWKAVVNAPSVWIWGDNPVADPVNETNQTFLKKFGWNGPVTSAILTIAADNSYSVTVNDTLFGGDATEKNFITADVHNLTTFIGQGNNELEIAVKNWAQANGTASSNPAGLKYELVITGTDAKCDVPYVEPVDPVATVIAHKIVCTDEADLPNWGAVDANTISSTTAAQWVLDHKSCKFESGWNFEWAPQSTTNPDNALPATALYGAAGGNWTTFGPTDINGKTQVTLTASQISGMTNIWMREVLKTGYIPFTYGPTNATNTDSFSAEMYCHTDVFNYDNYDRVDGIKVGETYNCVAWNHKVKSEDPQEPAPICDLKKNLIVNGSFEADVVTSTNLWQKFASVMSWVTTKVVDNTPTTLEIHKGWSGNLAADGLQYAELDGDVSSMVSQNIETIPGKSYELQWSFAPRHDITADQNKLKVFVNNSEVAQNGPAVGAAPLALNDWINATTSFVAIGTSTKITLADYGPSNSYGTYVDNVKAYCLSSRIDDGSGEGEGDGDPADPADPVPTTPGSSSNSGGYGGPALSRTPAEMVAGDSISVPEMMPLTQGVQVTEVPFGAPGTGHGGSAATTGLTMLQLLFVQRRQELA